MNLHEFEKDFPGVRLLTVSLEDIVPGAILNRHLNRVAHVSEFLGGQEADWPPKPVAAEFAQITDSASRDVSGGLNILGLVKLGVSGNHKLDASFTITDVTAEELAGHGILELRAKFAPLKADAETWGTLQHKLVVTETFLATRVEVEVKRQSGGGVDVDLKKVTTVDVSANAKAAWASDTKLVITGNGKVPFAVRGFLPNP